MELEVTGEVVFWRGPSPYHFLPVPEGESADIDEIAASVTYGWGVIPVSARLGGTSWQTSLFPKDGRYLVPLKDAVRRAEGVSLGDVVTVQLAVGRG